MLNANEINSQIKIGWNLGNTLDSFDYSGNEPDKNCETGWGNPVTTPEMIRLITDCGFNTIRIPVSWQGHMSLSDGRVDRDWMHRVTEVVGYCLEAGAFTILNTHHENRWLFNDPATSEEQKDQVYKVLWSQIADCFHDYPDTLLFEGLNEPRLEFGENEWIGATKEVRARVNHLEKIFYNTAREKNPDRTLLVTTAAACPLPAATDDLILPDGSDANLMVSLHTYFPRDFTGLDGNMSHESGVWDHSRLPEVESFYADLDRVQKRLGVPVLITEDGAMYKDNEDDMIRWEGDVQTVLKKYGMRHILWDNGKYAPRGDNFGFIDRRDLKYYYPGYADYIRSLAD